MHVYIHMYMSRSVVGLNVLCVHRSFECLILCLIVQLYYARDLYSVNSCATKIMCIYIYMELYLTKYI